MQDLGHKSHATAAVGRDIVLPEANTGFPLKGDFERMARRRLQHPKPFKEGNWWWLLVREDVFEAGRMARRKKAREAGEGKHVDPRGGKGRRRVPAAS